MVLEPALRGLTLYVVPHILHAEKRDGYSHIQQWNSGCIIAGCGEVDEESAEN